MWKDHLNHKVAPLTVQEHIHCPISFCPDFIPYGGETKLIPGCKTVHFIEPETGKKVCNGNVLPYDYTSLRNIWHVKEEYQL